MKAISADIPREGDNLFLMKVLYISYDGVLDPLGSSQVVPYLIGLSRKGIDFTLMTYEKKERLKDKVKLDKLKSLLTQHRIKWNYLVYHKSPTAPATAYDIVHGLYHACRIILSDKIKLIHARSFVGAIPALLAAKLFGVKFLYDNRGFYPEERVDGNIWKRNGVLFRFAKFCENKWLNYADHIVCLTYRAKEILQAKAIFKDKHDKIEVIPTCVDTEKFKASGKNNDLVGKFGFSDRFVFVYCGSIGTWYLLDEMLEFFKVAKTINPKVFFLILTGFADMVKQKITQKGLKLEDFYITYADYEDVPRWISSADAGLFFIAPAYSKISSCPTKFGEALACGIPVVINAGIGDTDLFVYKYMLGVVLESFTPKRFAEAAKQIFEMAGGDTAPSTRMRCRRFAEEFFGVEMAAEKYFSIYTKVYTKIKNPSKKIKCENRII